MKSPLEREYEDVGGPYGLAITNGFSDRKAIYMMVISAMEHVKGSGKYNEIL
ncbi:hypothetical protein [Bacillus sp. V5-8f]|uniref:hypothetical protein n=1 Tax=Bacillus sp. V5-8f TaxID=2053044 RepID=UPI0015E0857E|nr:hypothetical protein [Bacillus sp. V5-8f]